MRNEKLVPTTLPDPKQREPYLPKPNGDNKLTAEMVPYYTGKYMIQRAILVHLSRYLKCHWLHRKAVSFLVECMRSRSVIVHLLWWETGVSRAIWQAFFIIYWLTFGYYLRLEKRITSKWSSRFHVWPWVDQSSRLNQTTWRGPLM